MTTKSKTTMTMYMAFNDLQKGLLIHGYEVTPVEGAPNPPTELHHVTGPNLPIEYSSRGYFVKNGDMGYQNYLKPLIAASLSKEALTQKITDYFEARAAQAKDILQQFEDGTLNIKDPKEKPASKLIKEVAAVTVAPSNP